MAKDPFAAYRERLEALPATKKIYYEQPADVEFEAIVLDQFDKYIVLDQSLFYPEGGGQPADVGTLVSENNMVQVDNTTKQGEVILHRIEGGSLRRGD